MDPIHDQPLNTDPAKGHVHRFLDREALPPNSREGYVQAICHEQRPIEHGGRYGHRNPPSPQASPATTAWVSAVRGSGCWTARASPSVTGTGPSPWPTTCTPRTSAARRRPRGEGREAKPADPSRSMAAGYCHADEPSPE